jgi:hypothetical protein
MNARRSQEAGGTMRAGLACSTARVLWLSRMSVIGCRPLEVDAMGYTNE